MCFFCHNFQESTQDSFIYSVILHNIISSVRCCIYGAQGCSDFMDMLRRLISCRIIIIIIIIIVSQMMTFKAINIDMFNIVILPWSCLIFKIQKPFYRSQNRAMPL